MWTQKYCHSLIINVTACGSKLQGLGSRLQSPSASSFAANLKNNNVDMVSNIHVPIEKCHLVVTCDVRKYWNSILVVYKNDPHSLLS